MATESLFPTGEFSKVNFTGDYTSVDDPQASPGSDWMDPTDDGTNNNVTFSFDSPSGDLTTGADLQTVKVHVRKQLTGGTDPSMTIEVREAGGGTAVVTLVSGETITSDTGEDFTYTFDASALSDITGADFELFFSGARSGGPAANRRNLSIGAVEFVADYVAAGAGHPYFYNRRRLA